MLVRRVERRLRWAWCLPMLLALLFSGVLPAVGRGAMGVLRAGSAGTVQAPAVSPTHPLAVGDAEARVAAQRGEGSSARFVVVAGRAVYRLAALTGRWMVRAVAVGSLSGERGELYRGRGPPTRA